jgi:hypothetical protein
MSYVKCSPSTLEGTRKATEPPIRIAMFNFEFRTYKLSTKTVKCNPVNSIFIPKYVLFICSVLELNVDN